MNLDFLKKNTIIIWCLIIFFIGGCIRLFAINEKQDLHLDEALSVLLSNYSEVGWTKMPQENQLITGKDLKQSVYWNDSSIKDSLSDISRLYLYTRDDPHTNLYYSIFRLTFTGVDNFNLKDTIIRGGLLNLCFYGFSFFFMYKLLKLFLKKELLPFGLFVAFINPATISNTVLLRPYQIQETAFIALTYIFSKFFLEIKNNTAKFNTKNSIVIALTIAFTFLTGYYSTVYVGLLALILIINAIKNNNLDLKKFLTKTAFLSILITTFCYPVYFLGLISYRVTNSLEQVSSFGINLKQTFINFPLIYLTHLFSFSLIFYLCYLMFKKHVKTTSAIPLLFKIGMLWSLLIIYIAPYKELRYIMPIFPIVSMIIPFIVSKLEKTLLPILIISGIFLLNVFIAFAFLQRPEIGKYIPFISKLEYLKNNEVDNFLFEDNKTLPVIIVKQQTEMWIGELLQISNILPYFNDNQLYAFIDVENIPKLKLTHFYSIIPKNPKSEYKKLSQPFYKKYQEIKLQNCSRYYNCIEFNH